MLCQGWTKMRHEYFPAIVTNKYFEETEKKTNTGMLWFKKTTITKEIEYFIESQISKEVIFKIKVEKDVYDAASINDKFSIHLGFKYEFSCFHFMPIKEKQINKITADETDYYVKLNY